MTKDYSKDLLNVTDLLLEADYPEDIAPIFEKYGVDFDYEYNYSLREGMALKLGVVDEPDWDDLGAVDEFDKQVEDYWYQEKDEFTSIRLVKHDSQLMKDLIKWYGSKENMVEHVRGGYMFSHQKDSDLFFYTGYGYDWLLQNLFNVPTSVAGVYSNSFSYDLIDDVLSGKKLAWYDEKDYQKYIG